MNKYEGRIGLWKSKKQDKNNNYYYSGKIEGTDHWVNLFKVVSTNEKAPQLTLVLPEGYEIAKKRDTSSQGDSATSKNVDADDIPF